MRLIQILNAQYRHAALRRASTFWLLNLALVLAAPAATLQLGIEEPSSANESNRVPYLEWTAEADKIYRVQHRADLSLDSWNTVEPVRADIAGPVRWLAPEAIQSRGFFRLVLPQPEVLSVEPALVDSSDPDASLSLLGQCLPTNALVEINGVIFTNAIADASGTELRVSLNGLPPGQPILGTIRILDAGTSNVITTWTVQSPLAYGTELTTEQLQGPPAEPPASPAKKDFKGHVTLMKAFDDEDGDAAARKHTKTGHVTLMKAFDDEEDSSAARGHTKTGHVTLMKRGDSGGSAARGKGKTGHVTLMKAFDDEEPAAGARIGRGHELKGHVTLIKREMAPGPDDDCDGVFAATGEFRLQEADLVIPGRGLDFTWVRTYSSRTGSATAQGAGWDFSYNVSLAPQPDGTAMLRTGDGRVNTFYPDGTNGWLRDEHFVSIGDLDQDGYPDVVTFPDGGQWLFQVMSGDGSVLKLWKIVDRNSNALTLGYDLAGRLTTIVDTLDRTNVVAYNPSGLIESVTDFSGRVVRYEYDGQSDLVGCVSPPVTGTPLGNDFPGGKTNRYAYTSGSADDRLNHNLTACVDPQGQTWLQVVYQTTTNAASLDFDAVDNLFCGTTTHLRRFPQTPSSKNGFACVKSIVCDAVGNVTECFYDSRQRCLRQLEFTGRSNPSLPVTESGNRPAGKLRADDPDYFETQWAWNPDSLCTRELRPGGDSTEIVHQRAQDHNSSRSNKTASRKHDGDVRVLRERASAEGGDLDGDGAPDITELAWYFEYDPRFGSPPSRAQDHNSSRSNKTASRVDGGDNTPIIKGSALGGLTRKGWDGKVKGNTGINEVLPYATLRHKGWDGTIKGVKFTDQDCDGFATRVTDPRGNVTTAEYDSQGNAGRITFKAKEGASLTRAQDYAYNVSGQLTAITNAADANGLRRVDAFSYHASGPQAGLLASISIDEPGVHLTTSFEYDDRGNVTRLVDPRGNDWVYTYNALDQCVRAQSPTNNTVRCETTHLLYDANDNLVQSVSELRDEADAFVRNVSRLAEYDLLDRCVAVADQVSPGVFVTNRFEYDGNGQLTAVLSPLAVSGADPHNQVAFEYDERGLLFREIGAPGSGNSPTNEYGYSLNGLRTRINQLETVLKAQGILARDGFGRPITHTDAMSNVVSCVYDRNGNLTRVRYYGETNDVPGSAGNRLLAETRYTYDSLDRCVQQVDSFFDVFTELPISDGQSVTTFSFAPNGACTSVTDDNARTTRYAYDTAGRCSQIIDPKTNIVQFAYDACGNVTGMTSFERPDSGGAEQQFSRGYTYDALGRCVQTADNVGNATACAYDSLGRTVLHTDARANDTVFAYDDLGRCVASTNHVGARSGGITINTSHVEYDTKDRVVSETDGNTNTTTYAYDSLDRCVSVTEADGTSCHLIWSPRSNLISVEDANGTTVTNTYDLCDRIIHRDIAARGGAAATTTFETFAYDGLSRCVSAANDASLATFAFDSLGNCVRSTQDGLTTTSTYDGVGNCTSMTYPSGGTVTCAYDALGQLSSVSRSAGGGLPPVLLASYAYDGPDRLGRITRANGVETRVQWNGKVNPPNAAGDFGWRQVSGVSHQESAGARAILDRRAFAYDSSQNKLERAQTVPFYLGGPTTTNLFAYDALDRLTQFTRESGGADDFLRFYSLDSNGNRQFAASNGLVANYVMEATIPPADFQMDQYTLTPFGSQMFDENGNLTGRASPVSDQQYVYDYADRLVAVNDLAGGFPAPVAMYAYDALGRRIGKTLFPTGGLPPVTTLFVHDGNDCDDDDPIEEHENGSLKKTHVIPHVLETKGCGMSGKAFVLPHVFEQKGRMLVVAGGPTLHLHTDDLGNTLAVTDDSGAVVERYDYDDFGLPSFLTSDGAPLTGSDGLPATSSPAGNPFLFRSMEWDGETGLYLASKRFGIGATAPEAPLGTYLDPQTGRATRGKVKDVRDSGMGFSGINPWTGGPPPAMKKGTVKFFNEAKGFGRVTGEAGGRWKAPELQSGSSLIVPVAMDKGLRFRGSAARVSRSILKSYFETGDKPTQSQFSALLDRSAKHTKTGHVTLMK